MRARPFFVFKAIMVGSLFAIAAGADAAESEPGQPRTEDQALNTVASLRESIKTWQRSIEGSGLPLSHLELVLRPYQEALAAMTRYGEGEDLLPYLYKVDVVRSNNQRWRHLGLSWIAQDDKVPDIQVYDKEGRVIAERTGGEVISWIKSVPRSGPPAHYLRSELLWIKGTDDSLEDGPRDMSCIEVAPSADEIAGVVLLTDGKRRHYVPATRGYELADALAATGDVAREAPAHHQER